MSRWFLYGLAALTVAAAGFAAIVVGFGGVTQWLGGDEAPKSIMILSDNLLESKVESVNEEVVRDSLMELYRQRQLEGEKSKGAEGAAAVASENAASAGDKPPATSKKAPSESNKTAPNSTPTRDLANADEQKQKHLASNLALVLKDLEDSLEGSVGEDFQQSGRFRLIPNTSVIEAMADVAKQSGVPAAEFGKRLMRPNPKSGAADRGAGDKNDTPENEMLRSGIGDLSRKVHADYILMFDLVDPEFTYEVVQDSDDYTFKYVLDAQPIINCELIDTRSSLQAYRFSEQLPRPVTESIGIEADAPMKAKILQAYNRLISRLNKAVSQRVLAWALDKVSPAKVLRVEGPASQPVLVINRGANDGLSEGAVLSVEHEQGAVLRDNSANLGRETIPVGVVRVDRVEQKFAHASVISGGAPAVGDLVHVRTDPSGRTMATTGDTGPQLGRLALSQADAANAAGIAVRRANVAVDGINLREGGRLAYSQSLTLAVSDALQKDRRINILPRTDLDRLMHERKLDQRFNDDNDQDAKVGIASSGFLVDGEFELSSHRHVSSMSLGGQSVQTGVATTTEGAGTLRATTIDGKLIASIAVTSHGGGMDALVALAARKLMLELFPMRVVAIGPAPDVVTLDRGDDGGLRVGARVRIYRRGAAVVDRDTGAMLSEGPRTLLGEVTVFDVEPGAGVSQARIVGSAFQPRVNDAAYLADASSPPQSAPSARPSARRATAPGAKPATTPDGFHW